MIIRFYTDWWSSCSLRKQVRRHTEIFIDFLISTFLPNCYAGNINYMTNIRLNTIFLYLLYALFFSISFVGLLSYFFMFSDVCAVVCGWELRPDGSNLKAAQRENPGHHWVLQPPVPRVPRTCSQTYPNLPQILSAHEEGWLWGRETWAFCTCTDKQTCTSAVIICAMTIPQKIQNV